MPVYEFERGGRRYQIEAPDPQRAVAAFRQAAPSQRLAPGRMDDAFAPSPGATPELTRKAQIAALPVLPSRSFGRDVNNFVRGAADTLSFGFADEIAAGADAALNPLLGTGAEGQSFHDRYRQNVEAQRGLDADGGGARLAGQLTGGLAGGVGMVRSGLSPTAAAVRGGYRLPAVATMSAGEGATMGALYGAGSSLEGRRGDGAAEGAKAGAVLGALTPVATGAIRRAVSPIRAPAERTRQAGILRQEGVDTTAGQRTGSNALRYAEGEIGGAPAARVMDRQAEQFTAAALRRIGVNATRATPDVIDQAYTQIGQRFDDLSARNWVRVDAQVTRDLNDAVVNAFELIPESQRAPALGRIAQDIDTALQQGWMSGEAFKAVTSRLSRMARASAKDPELSMALREVKEALDDAMERTLAQMRSPDLGAWREVRNQYRNFLTIERAATGAGEQAAMGIITPSALRNATVQTQGRRNYARGRGDLAELSRAGEAVMKPLPNSGTAGRTAARSLGTGIPTVIGAALGAPGGVMGSLAGAAAGAAAPWAAGRVMMTRPVQAWLGNQTATIPPATQALVDAMLRSAAIPQVAIANGR